MNKWTTFENYLSELQTLQSVAGVLSWDQKTNMPPKAATLRSEQLTLLSAMVHQKLIDNQFSEIIEEATEEASSIPQKRAIKEARRSRDRSLCLPVDLVQAFTKAKSAATNAWAQAKSDNDYALFAPHLKKIIELSREKATCYGTEKSMYDNLLDDYDPGVTTASLIPMFAELKAALVPLVDEVTSRNQGEEYISNYSLNELDKINKHVIDALLFDRQAGRLDESDHPFTIGLAPSDVRLTTRNLPSKILGTLGGTIHECGHGLYEQGLPSHWKKMGLCHAPGAGIHESQSRFYENVIGRSLEFFEWLAPTLHEISPTNSPSAAELYIGANRAKQSLIRVEADETTYNLHIIIRFEIEQALLNGDLSTKDAPQAWDDAHQKNLGLRPSNYSDGILQDIHWSLGYFGYFPSYTIGNLYAAGYKQALKTEHPTLFEDIRKGEFQGVLNWLRQKIHQQGNIRPQEEIVANAIGERNQVDDLITHLQERHTLIQQLL
jgi:carboxypeptidase Taq